jgi:hypothetical protein
MRTLLEFGTVTAAKAYRYNNGTGGWIFWPETGYCVLFPPDMCHSDIMKHPIVQHRDGELVGAG